MRHTFPNSKNVFKCSACGKTYDTLREAERCCFRDALEVNMVSCASCRHGNYAGNPTPMCPNYAAGMPADKVCPSYEADRGPNQCALQSSFEEEMRLHAYSGIPMFQ